MRIALVVHKFPPVSVGGTEIYTQNLARELSAQGHEVMVFSRRFGANSAETELVWEERPGFQVAWVSRAFDPGSAPPWSQFLDTFFNPDVEDAFQQFLDIAQPDVIHFQHVMLLSYRLVRLAKQRGIPALLTLHDYWFICSNSQLIWPDSQICKGKALGMNCARCALTNRIASPVLRTALRPPAAVLLQLRDTLVRRAVLQADTVIAPSHFLIDRYVEEGLPPERFICLENGIDLEHIQRYDHRPAEDGRVRFTYLGSLAWQKGVHILVEAFRDIPAGEARLRIYGPPDVFPDYSARLRELANPANTSFEGQVPNEEVGQVLAETDVLVVPSLWYENSPVVIQEARAAGVPVIASNLGALPEKVGDSGWLFSPGSVEELRDHLKNVVEMGITPALRENLPAARSIDDATEELLALYREIATGRPTMSPSSPIDGRDRK